MGDFTLVHPRDDAIARQASDWCQELAKQFQQNGHTLVSEVNDTTPPSQSNIVNCLGHRSDLICYFGHGDEDSWLTSGSPTIESANISSAANKAVVSIACKTGQNLGPSAITAGVVAWLGFTVKVAVNPIYKGSDPVGEAIVDGLACLGTGGSLQDAHDRMASNFDQLVQDYDTGSLSRIPDAGLGYFSCMIMRDRIVVHGNVNHTPL